MGTPGPRGGAEAGAEPRGVFLNPNRAEGDLAKIPVEETRITFIVLELHLSLFLGTYIIWHFHIIESSLYTARFVANKYIFISSYN